jgi:hypothetical protein
LTSIGVINTDGNEKRVFRPKSEDSPLLLSKMACDRIYAPDGSFSHHHSVQYLTFSPPFDSNYKPVEIAMERDCANSSLGSQSAATTSTDAACPKGSVLSALGFYGRNNSIAQAPPEDCSDVKDRKITLVNSFVAPMGNGASENENNSENSILYARRRTLGGMVSKLYCCKNKDRLLATRPVNLIATLTEEQERQWSSFDIRPISEDNRSTAGQSVVSMSAPLLTTQHHRMQTSEFLFCEFFEPNNE